MSWTIDEYPTALQYFASLVQSDENFALMEAAISIAQDAEPDCVFRTNVTGDFGIVTEDSGPS